VSEISVRSMKFCGFVYSAGRMHVKVHSFMRASMSPLLTYICELFYFSFYRKIVINVHTRLDSQQDKTFFCSRKSSDRLWGIPALPFSVSKDYSPQVKRPEAPESSGEVKNEWSFSSTPTICKGWLPTRALRAAL
jgi:hypothetical protein